MMQTWLNNASWTWMSATGPAGRALWRIGIWIWASGEVHRAQRLCWVLHARLITNACFFELWMLQMWRVHFTNGSMTCVRYKRTPDHRRGTYCAEGPPCCFTAFLFPFLSLSIPFFLLFFFFPGLLSQAATGFSWGGFESLFPRKLARCRYHDNKTSFGTK